MSSKNYFLLTDFLSEIQAKKIFGVDTAIIAITNANNPLHCFNLLKDSKGLSESTIILIDALLLNSGLKAQLGVDVLKWLRIKGYRQHVVVYSAYPLQTLLLHKPENIILCSPGVTYLQIPFGLQAISFNSLSEMPKGIDLKPFLKPCFSIEDYRHQHANWWGVKRMYDLYSLAVDKKPMDEVGYPEIVKSKLMDLNNCIGDYLFNTQRKANQAKKENIRRDLSDINFHNTILHIDDEANHGWTDLINKLFFPNENQNPLVSADIAKVLSWVKNISDSSVPDCFSNISLILLDLRLEKEDEERKLAEVSGVKVLRAIRERVSMGVPVIVTTASNKAWTLEKMFEYGADGYWIKEGIDNNWNYKEAISNINTLITLIRKATGKEYAFYMDYVSKCSDLQSQNTHWWEKHTWENKEETKCDKMIVFSVLEFVRKFFRAYLITNVMGYGYDPNNNPKVFVRQVIKELSLIFEMIHNLDQNSDNNISLGSLAYDRKDRLLGSNLRYTRNEAVHSIDPNSDFGAWEYAQKNPGQSYDTDYKSFINNFFKYLNVSPSARGTT